MKLAALAFAATLGLGGSAYADHAGPFAPAPAAPGASLGDPAAGRFAGPGDPSDRPGDPSFDRSRGERGQGRGEMRQILLERFDRDRDGRLDAKERHRAIRALRRMAHRMAQQDRRVAVQGRRDLDATARREARMRALVQRFDRDGDGVVGPDEMPPGLARRLQRLDRNGDGWLDERDGRLDRRRAPRDSGPAPAPTPGPELDTPQR